MRRALACAKVNLVLHVLGRRTDGYHEIESLVAFAGVGDRLTVRPAATRELAVTGAFAGALSATGDHTANLVWRAVDGFVAAFGGPDYAITLEKALPIAAGIGGGSADAAAALRALADLAAVPRDEPRLEALARALGADVPACLGDRPCLVHGIGQEVVPLSRFPAVPVVLVNPGAAMPTGPVFRAWAQAPADPPHGAPWRESVVRAATAADLARALAGTGNALERPAIGLAPIVADVLARLRERDGCVFARMSGSGATCFGLFEDDGKARAAAARLKSRAPDWWVVSTRLRGWPERPPG